MGTEDGRRIKLVRQSRRKDDTISPEVQHAKIDKHLADNGLVAVATVEEIGVPGDIERDGLNEAIEMVERGEAGGIVCAVFDRLGREELGIYQAFYRLEQAGGVMEFAGEPGLDPQTEAGRILIAVNAAMSKGARMRIGSNWQDAKARAVMKEGIHISNTVPPGYDRTSKAEGRKLVPNERAHLIRKLFEMRADGASSVTLARWLDEVWPQPRPWQPMRVLRILSNRVYLGIAYYGKWEKENAHPALVTPLIFRKAQFAKANSLGVPYSNRRLLAELIHCEGCRHSLSKANGNAGEGMYYRCRIEHTHYACEHPASIRAEEAEEYVVTWLMGYLEKRNIRALTSMTSYTDAVAELEEIRADIEEFYPTTLRIKRKDPERWARMEAELLKREAEAEVKVRDLTPTPANVPVHMDRETFETLDMTQKRSTLSGYIEAVVLRGRGEGRWADRAPLENRILIIPAGTGLDWPRKGRTPKGYQHTLRPFDWPRDAELGPRVKLA